MNGSTSPAIDTGTCRFILARFKCSQADNARRKLRATLRTKRPGCRLHTSELKEPEWPVGHKAPHERQGDVVDGNVSCGVAVGRPFMCVSMKYGSHAIAPERLLETAAPEIRKDFPRLTFHRLDD